MSKFPNLIIVTHVEESNGASYLVASRNVEEALTDDGPQLVGTYKLVGKRRLVRVVKEVPLRRKRGV